MSLCSIPKTAIFLLLLVLLLCGAEPCRAQPAPPASVKTVNKSPSFYLDRGKVQLERQQYAAAVRSLSMVVRATPGVAEAYYLRGRAFDKLGMAHKAIRDLSRYIELKPDDPQGYILRGDTRNFNGEHEAALADYSQAIRRSSRSIPAYLGRGLAYAALERYGQAIKDYQWVLALDPNNNEAAENMALACMRSGRHLQAVGYFERALRHEKDPVWRGKIEKWLEQVVNDPNLEKPKTEKSDRPKPPGPTAKPLW
jgi:tetratricopeptide (TPR) repeat protein